VRGSLPTLSHEKDDDYFAGEVGVSSAEADESVEEEVVPASEFSHACGDTVTSIYHINDSCKHLLSEHFLSLTTFYRGSQIWQVCPLVGCPRNICKILVTYGYWSHQF